MLEMSLRDQLVKYGIFFNLVTELDGVYFRNPEEREFLKEYGFGKPISSVEICSELDERLSQFKGKIENHDTYHDSIAYILQISEFLDGTFKPLDLDLTIALFQGGFKHSNVILNLYIYEVEKEFVQEYFRSLCDDEFVDQCDLFINSPSSIPLFPEMKIRYDAISKAIHDKWKQDDDRYQEEMASYDKSVKEIIDICKFKAQLRESYGDTKDESYFIKYRELLDQQKGDWVEEAYKDYQLELTWFKQTKQ